MAPFMEAPRDRHFKFRNGPQVGMPRVQCKTDRLGNLPRLP